MVLYYIAFLIWSFCLDGDHPCVVLHWIFNGNRSKSYSSRTFHPSRRRHAESSHARFPTRSFIRMKMDDSFVASSPPCPLRPINPYQQTLPRTMIRLISAWLASKLKQIQRRSFVKTTYSTVHYVSPLSLLFIHVNRLVYGSRDA